MTTADPTTVQYCAQCRREVPTTHTRATGWVFAPGVVLTYDGRAYCSGACHAAKRDATLAKFEAGRAERRARAEAELLSPSFPPKFVPSGWTLGQVLALCSGVASSSATGN